jgi:hypothetical protein
LPQVFATDSRGKALITQGVVIPLGTSKAVPVALFSEARIADWKVSAHDLPRTTPPPATPNLSFAWDRTSGNNGDVLNLSITVNAVDPAVGGNVFSISSTDGVLTHSVYGYVAQH